MAFHMDAAWTCVTFFAKALHPDLRMKGLFLNRKKSFYVNFYSDPKQNIDLVAILVGSTFCVIFALAEQGLRWIIWDYVGL